MLTRILVPLDGSVLAGMALDLVKRLAGSNSEITLITSVFVPETPIYAEAPLLSMPPSFPTLESAKADAKRHLEEVTNHLRDSGYHVNYRVEVGDPVENITRVANELDVDMIAMSTHGRSGLSRLIFGSVTSGVLKAALRPVLVIPSNYTQRQEEREVSELNFS